MAIEQLFNSDEPDQQQYRQCQIVRGAADGTHARPENSTGLTCGRRRMIPFGMARKRVGEMLIEAGLISSSQLQAALTEQKRWGGQLGRILIESRSITEEALVACLSTQLATPAVKLDDVKPTDAVLALVTADQADKYGLIPLAVDGKFLDVAIADPTNMTALDELRLRTKLNIRAFIAGPNAIARALAKYYGRGFSGLGLGTAAIAIQKFGEADSAAPRGAGEPPGDDTVEGAAVRRIATLVARVTQLEELVARDEDVLRKLLGLLIDKGVATREEVIDRLKQ